MGRDSIPQAKLQHACWQFSDTNSTSNNLQFGVSPQNFNSMMFPANVNPYVCICSANAASPLPGVYTNKSGQMMPHHFPSHKLPELVGSDTRYLVHDQSSDRRNFIVCSSGLPFPWVDSVNLVFDQQGNNEIIASNGHGAEEMLEDTEEIDALLYSDSDLDQDDEETSTGHNPAGVMERSSSEVASSLLPAKRRRVDEHKLDVSLIETTSSQVFHCPDAPRDHSNKEVDRVAESSCIKGVDHDQNEGDMQLKRTRIRETIGLLRRIIPGGHGKDAVTVLDEAICYLKSLKLKKLLQRHFHGASFPICFKKRKERGNGFSSHSSNN